MILYTSGIIHYNHLTFLPHKAVAEVSKDKEPIGRECLEFNWFESQLMSDSNELRVKWFGCHLTWGSNEPMVVDWFEIQLIWLSIDLRFKWFGCQSMCASNDFGSLLIWTSSDVVVNWLEIQVIWLSTDLRFKWVGCQLIWDSSDLDVKWFEVQMIWLSTDVWFKWYCQTKLFCEISFKNEALNLKNEAFVRNFLQKRSFESQKRNFCARLPSKTKLSRSKSKHFCETSFKNDKLTRHLTSEFQYVLTIFKWMFQKYCACHEKVEPRHTKSCNCHAKWSLQSNTSVTWNFQPFHGFCVGGFKHRHHKARNHCACHAKRIVSDPLQIPHACQRFCNPHELLCLPRILQRVEIPAPATRNTFEPPKTSRAPGVLTILTSESLSRAGVVQVLRSSTSKKRSEHAAWCRFFVKIALARRRGAIFVEINFQKCSKPTVF